MRNKFTYNLVLQHDATSSSGGRSFSNGGGKSRSRYQGGFIKKNGRSNNSSAYNHDYYMRNKDKWKTTSSRSSNDFGDGEYERLHAEYNSWSDEKKAAVSSNQEVITAYYNHMIATQNWERLAHRGPNDPAPTEKEWQAISDAANKTRKTHVDWLRTRSRVGAEYDKQNSASNLIGRGVQNARKPSNWSKEYMEALTYNSRKNRYFSR